MSNEARVDLVDGRAVVMQADPTIWMADALWDEILADPEQPSQLGGWHLMDDVLAFGTAGQGLGRVYYRYERHDPQNSWHILTRITT